MISGDDDNDDSFLDIDDCVFVKFLVFINKHEQLSVITICDGSRGFEIVLITITD